MKALTWERAGMFEGPKVSVPGMHFFFMLAMNHGSQTVGEGYWGKEANQRGLEARLRSPDVYIKILALLKTSFPPLPCKFCLCYYLLLDQGNS